MKYKVGDRVQIRLWNDMAKEFGVDTNGDINCMHLFTEEMRKYCGTIHKIVMVETYFGRQAYRLDIVNDDYYVFTDDMIKRKVNEMTKHDLKDGMVCKTRNKDIFIWLNGELMSMNCFVGGIKDNLSNNNNSDYDIVEIYESDACTINKMFDVENHGTLVWKREEPKEMTIAEVEQLLGYPVKIVRE